MTKTVTRLFTNYQDATAAVAELEQMGVPHADLSIMANNDVSDHVATAPGHAAAEVAAVDDHGDVSRGVSTGAVVGGVGGLLAGLGVLAIPGLGPIVAAGWLASTIAGAGIGAAGGAATGGIVGALKNAGHTDEDAHVYAEGVRRGSTLVSARVPDDLEAQAESVLSRHSGADAATRGADYRNSGWTGFDENAGAMTADELARERTAYATTPLI